MVFISLKPVTAWRSCPQLKLMSFDLARNLVYVYSIKRFPDRPTHSHTRPRREEIKQDTCTGSVFAGCTFIDCLCKPGDLSWLAYCWQCWTFSGMAPWHRD